MSEEESAKAGVALGPLEGDCCRERWWRDWERGDAPPSSARRFDAPGARTTFDMVCGGVERRRGVFTATMRLSEVDY